MITKQYTAPVLLLMLLLAACSDSGTQAPRALDAAAIETNNHAVGLMGRFEYANTRHCNNCDQRRANPFGSK